VFFLIVILSIAIFFVFKIKKGEESAMVPAEHIPNSRQRASLESRSTRELSERSESQSRVGGVESDRFNSEVRQIIILYSMSMPLVTTLPESFSRSVKH
jgi:hypothetical protein